MVVVACAAINFTPPLLPEIETGLQAPLQSKTAFQD
jgi:hypothetical protein